MIRTLSRIMAIWKESLKLEKERPKTGRKGVELEFLPAAVEIMDTPVSPVGRTLFLSLCVLFTLVVGIAYFGRIDIEAVAAGKLVPVGNIKTIQSLEMAKVEAILVEEGMNVKKGDPLIRLDPTERETDFEQVRHDLLHNRLIAERAELVLETIRNKQSRIPSLSDHLLSAESDFPMLPTDRQVALHQSILIRSIKQHHAQVEDYLEQIEKAKAEKNSARVRIRRLKTLLPIYLEEETSREKLMSQRFVDRAKWLESKERVVNTREQIEVEESSVVQIDAEIRALRKRINTIRQTFLSERLGELAEARTKSAQLGLAMVKAEERQKNLVLRAPVDGIVNQLQVHTIGAVVQPANPLMSIVPADTKLQVEAMVENKDIGFIEKDQIVEVKIDSFPYTKYGLIEGKVATISLDALEQEDGRILFPVKIAIEQQHVQVGTKNVPLVPDMTVSAEVKTGDRRVIEYFLTPFIRYQDETLGER